MGKPKDDTCVQYVCALWEIPAKQKSVQSERDQYEQAEGIWGPGAE